MTSRMTAPTGESFKPSVDNWELFCTSSQNFSCLRRLITNSHFSTTQNYGRLDNLTLNWLKAYLSSSTEMPRSSKQLGTSARIYSNQTIEVTVFRICCAKNHTLSVEKIPNHHLLPSVKTPPPVPRETIGAWRARLPCQTDFRHLPVLINRLNKTWAGVYFLSCHHAIAMGYFVKCNGRNALLPPNFCLPFFMYLK